MSGASVATRNIYDHINEHTLRGYYGRYTLRINHLSSGADRSLYRRPMSLARVPPLHRQ